MSKEGFGMITAILFCPCHIALYGFILIILGVGGSVLSTWLLPVMSTLFVIGLAMIFIPRKDKSCCVKLVKPLETV